MSQKTDSTFETTDKDIQTQALEQTGEMGTICGQPHNDAMTIFFTSSTDDFRKLYHEVTNPDDRKEVINWYEYLQWASGAERKRRYSEYRRSPAWKRKRDMVIEDAKRPIEPPEDAPVKRKFDKHGRIIEYLEVEWKPLCQKENCQNEATQVHHLHYDSLGKEDIENDLQALCGECHQEYHKSSSHSYHKHRAPEVK